MTPSRDKDCIFCQIVAKELPAAIVYEDQIVLAFLDQRPLFLGHTLLIPKDHYQTLYDLPNSKIEKFFASAKIVGRAIQESLNASGTFLATNNYVSQSVPHLHLHIVPRSKGDGLRGFFWPRQHYENEEQMQRIAQQINQQIKHSP